MSIIDKANEYIGHPREVDEGYEVSMRRDAYAQGYQDAIDKACEWMKEQVYQEYGGGPLERLIPDTRIEEFRKAMEE